MITLRYVAKRLDQGGSYEGRSTLAPVKTSWGGHWSGEWENVAGEKGADSLLLTEDASGNLSGTWSGNVKVYGKRISAHTADLSGQTANRAYRLAATLNQGTVSLNYVAVMLDREGAYEGKSTLTPAK